MPPPDFGGQGWIKVDGLIRAISGEVDKMDDFYL